MQVQEVAPVPVEPAMAATTRSVIDDSRMRITEEEREWAKQIKAAVDRCPELDPVSDFMYAQEAIVAMRADPTEANLEVILERMSQFQEYRKQHSFPDRSYCAFSRKVLHQVFNDIVPGHYLSFAYYADESSYVLAADMSTFSRQVLNNHENQGAYLAVNWLLMEAQQPDFEAIRNGVTVMADCEGYDWKNKDMVNMGVMRLLSEIDSLYPVHVKKMKFFHTGMFANLCFAMTKKLMPPHMIKRVDVGCQWKGRLKEMFLLPNLETANRKNLSRIDEALRRRAVNEASFTLDSDSDSSGDFE